MGFQVPLDLDLLLAELVGAASAGRGTLVGSAPGPKSIGKADPVGSPADLDKVLPGKLQQIRACRGRQSQMGEEAWDQRWQGTQSTMSLQIAPVCPGRLGATPSSATCWLCILQQSI